MIDLKQKLTEANISFKENEDLSIHSTIRVTAKAKIFININDLETLKKFLEIKKDIVLPMVIIGEGSNTLFTKDYDGIVLRISLKVKETLEENDESVLFKVGSGENWHEFVELCVNKNLAGNENLAFIPGTIGAAPVQNIAAYGQEQSDTFETLDAINIKTGEIKTFNKEECAFAYRTSIFKNEFKDQYIIVSVNYRVYKVTEYIPETAYHSRYESLQGELSAFGPGPYTLKDVFNAIINIRKKKLPQVGSEYGTLGSFFLNPFITRNKLKEVQKDFPGIQFYPIEKMQYPGLDDEILQSAEIVKIPVAWLLEELGWKGKFDGNVGTFPNHSLCVVTKGEASGEEVMKYVESMKKSVLDATGIKLETEINVI